MNLLEHYCETSRHYQSSFIEQEMKQNPRTKTSIHHKQPVRNTYSLIFCSVLNYIMRHMITLGLQFLLSFIVTLPTFKTEQERNIHSSFHYMIADSSPTSKFILCNAEEGSLGNTMQTCYLKSSSHALIKKKIRNDGASNLNSSFNKAVLLSHFESRAGENSREPLSFSAGFFLSPDLSSRVTESQN